MTKTSGFDETPGGETGSRSPSGDLAAGSQVGEYVVEGQIGRGGMGTVYAARHPVIGKRVAVKVLAAHMASDAALVRRFIDEARAVNRIGHPNIIDIFAFGQLADGRHYFVMELLEGETLAARISAGAMTVDEARRLLGQTASALEAAHREKIVHRDLKPDNLWVARPKHGEPFIKVLDFGIAKLLELSEGRQVTETGMVVGTPHFMAPEQCMGQTVDARTDIYALGVILYRVFTGKLPFDGNTFAEVVAQHLAVSPARPSGLTRLTPDLESLILDCLEKDPARRPQSAAEVVRRLERALGGAPPEELTPAPLPGGAPPSAPGPPGTRPGYVTSSQAAREAITPSPARRWTWLVVALAVVGATVGAIAAVTRARREPGAAGGPPAAPTPAGSATESTAPASAPPASEAQSPPAASRPSPGTAAAPSRGALTVPPAGAAGAAPGSAGAGQAAVPDRQGSPSTASPQGGPAPTTGQGGRRAPSRAEQRGLIRENPFR